MRAPAPPTAVPDRPCVEPAGPAPRLAALAGVALVALAASGCHDANWLTFDWSDRPVLCSQSIDDHEGPPWKLITDQMQLAAAHDYVVLLHAHRPGETVRRRSIEMMLDLAAGYHLPMLTYRELDPAAPARGGVAFALDDNSIDRWFELRELFLRRHAHVTFFVSRFGSRTAAEREKLRVLAADGHDIEPHSANHRHVSAYVSDHGVDGYVEDEVLPSMDSLVGAGYDVPTIYAYPFGERTEGVDDAVLEYVPRVRVSPHSCPY
jgi:peptidoglycan/xylan/chitin deacetylase (PgdA/CDA1 family)